MRIFSITVITLLTVLPQINACEKECRKGISAAFADRYADVTAPIWDDLSKYIEGKMLDGVDLSPYVSTDDVAPLGNKIIVAAQTELSALEKEFSERLPIIIENSIFRKEPQFRGDCNHPHRVTQPKLGIPWEMEDCEKMDYICGNPPSICHFLSMIKERNIKTVDDDIDAKSNNGDFLSPLSLAVHDTLNRTDTFSSFQMSEIVGVVEDNLKDALEGFSTNYTARFCPGTECDKFDYDIKVKLLSYP